MPTRKKTYTFDELMSMQKEFEGRINAAIAEMDAKKSDVADVERRMEIAIETGNVPEYKELFARRGDLKFEIDMLDRMIAKSSNSSGFTEEDAETSWDEIASEYNRTSNDRISKMRQMIDKFKEEYESAMREQERVLSVRDEYITLLSRHAKDGHQTSSLYWKSRLSEIEFVPEFEIKEG